MCPAPDGTSATASGTGSSGGLGNPRVPWVVGVSGASGTPYAKAVLNALLDAHLAVDLVVSRAARLTLLDETGLPLRDAHWRTDLATWLARELPAPQAAEPGATESGATGADGPGVRPAFATAPPSRTAGGQAYPRTSRADPEPARELPDVRYWAAGDLAAGPSSGSYPVAGMIVVPASTAAVAGIALGLSKDLLQRAADVTLKERRPLVVVPRETPFTRATLAHLLALHDAGAHIVPASPGFYGGAGSVQQLVDFVAGKALDAIAVPHTLLTRWTGTLGQHRTGQHRTG